MLEFRTTLKLFGSALHFEDNRILGMLSDRWIFTLTLSSPTCSNFLRGGLFCRVITIIKRNILYMRNENDSSTYVCMHVLATEMQTGLPDYNEENALCLRSLCGRVSSPCYFLSHSRISHPNVWAHSMEICRRHNSLSRGKPSINHTRIQTYILVKKTVYDTLTGETVVSNFWLAYLEYKFWYCWWLGVLWSWLDSKPFPISFILFSLYFYLFLLLFNYLLLSVECVDLFILWGSKLSAMG